MISTRTEVERQITRESDVGKCTGLSQRVDKLEVGVVYDNESMQPDYCDYVLSQSRGVKNNGIDPLIPRAFQNLLYSGFYKVLFCSVPK